MRSTGGLIIVLVLTGLIIVLIIPISLPEIRSKLRIWNILWEFSAVPQTITIKLQQSNNLETRRNRTIRHILFQSRQISHGNKNTYNPLALERNEVHVQNSANKRPKSP
jgi:hypothetical protein